MTNDQGCSRHLLVLQHTLHVGVKVTKPRRIQSCGVVDVALEVPSYVDLDSRSLVDNTAQEQQNLAHR